MLVGRGWKFCRPQALTPRSKRAPPSVAGELPFILQAQNLPGTGYVAVFIRLRVTCRVHDIEIDGIVLQRQVTGFRQIMAADPTDAAAGGVAGSGDAESAVADAGVSGRPIACSMTGRTIWPSRTNSWPTVINVNFSGNPPSQMPAEVSAMI